MKKGLTQYVALLWAIMGSTGKGYHRPSVKHTGNELNRRNDKLREVTGIDEDGKTIVSYQEFYPPESKFQRSCRLGRVGL